MVAALATTRYTPTGVVPALPPGWSEVEVPLDQALVVRIRDAAHPDPPWFDYATERPAKKARRKR